MQRRQWQWSRSAVGMGLADILFCQKKQKAKGGKKVCHFILLWQNAISKLGYEVNHALDRLTEFIHLWFILCLSLVANGPLTHQRLHSLGGTIWLY